MRSKSGWRQNIRESRTLFQKARLRAFAAARGITNVSVSAGKLNVEGAAFDRSQRIRLKRSGGRYLPEKKKAIVPLLKVTSSDASDAELAGDVLRYLSSVWEGEPSDGE